MKLEHNSFLTKIFRKARPLVAGAALLPTVTGCAAEVGYGWHVRAGSGVNSRPDVVIVPSEEDKADNSCEIAVTYAILRGGALNPNQAAACEGRPINRTKLREACSAFYNTYVIARGYDVTPIYIKYCNLNGGPPAI